ncbi:MAG: four helix bundle protein [Acidobacteriota bacterium]
MDSKKMSDLFLKFSANVVKFCLPLNKNPVEKHISLQLVRSSKSTGANYEESRGAESRQDFIHKMQIVLKELKESLYWIKLLKEVGLLTGEKIEIIEKECDELVRMIGKAVSTSRNKGKK